MIICVKNLYGKKFLINKLFLWGNNVSYQMCHCQLLLLALRRRRRICGAKEIKVAKEKDWKRRGRGLSDHDGDSNYVSAMSNPRRTKLQYFGHNG